MVPQSDRVLEVATKLTRLRVLMVTSQVDVVVLNQLPNIAWLTVGASTHINLASDNGPSSLLITMDSAFVVTDRVEAERLEQEEFLPSLGFTLIVEPWEQRNTLVTPLITEKRLGQDGFGQGINLSKELQILRTHLQVQEVERLRSIGSLASAAIAEVMYAIQPGMTEFTIARMLSDRSLALGGYPVVNLVASDERVARYRHPLPTHKTVEHYVMVVLCLRSAGLIAAITRFIHFGPIPTELAAKAQACARIDAKMILGTRVGKSMSDMFTLASQAYHDEGYPTAITEHHQGGSIAYLPREIFAQPGETEVIAERQAFAWNPSIRGTKSEDTIILDASGPEVITHTQNWPMFPITIDNQTILRPAILEQGL